tara:strand:+ start:117011 stop:117316 length:306 start_codon:yes stop_codon:yes gene_type:complete
MLDVSWVEILFIVIIGILVIGPKELPTILYNLGRLLRRFQYMRYAILNQFDDFMQKEELRQAPSLKMPKAAADKERQDDEAEAELSFLKDLRNEVDEEEKF